MSSSIAVQKRRMQARRKRRERRNLLVFLLPMLFFIVVFLAFPLLSSAYLSLTDIRANIFESHKFIGLRGYYQTIFKDSFFHTAMRNQTVYAISYFVLTFSVSLFLAILINELKKGVGVLQVIFYLPMIIPLSIVGGIFLWIFSGTGNSFFNLVLARLGLAQTPPVNVYGDPRFALFGLVIARSWKMTGFTLIIFLAGLQGISKEVREAAQIDGANFRQTLFRVVLPMLKPYLLIGVTWILINSMKEFDLPAVVTFGGPGTATLTLYYRAWTLAFEYWEMSRSAQVSFITAILILAISWVFNRIFRPETAQRG
ncbi:MAG: sugar ABC transporter permease [Spirochaetaceae bacterium]|nr:MAG: sugar ABC transporter permease [Spirochaetaceae bacterium]